MWPQHSKQLSPPGAIADGRGHGQRLLALLETATRHSRVFAPQRGTRSSVPARCASRPRKRRSRTIATRTNTIASGLTATPSEKTGRPAIPPASRHRIHGQQHQSAHQQRRLAVSQNVQAQNQRERGHVEIGPGHVLRNEMGRPKYAQTAKTDRLIARHNKPPSGTGSIANGT